MVRRRLSRGFTLIELLIVIAIIGIIAALLVPNLLDAMQKAKQKRSMADMKLLGTAMFAWVTDQAGGAAAAGATTAKVDLSEIPTKTADGVASVLLPQYIQEIPAEDAWHTPFDYYFNTDNVHADHVLGVRSLGRDGQAMGTEYTVGAFDPTDYDQDLVWVDGGFVRWPQRTGS